MTDSTEPRAEGLVRISDVGQMLDELYRVPIGHWKTREKLHFKALVKLKALPSAAGGEDKLREALKEISELMAPPSSTGSHARIHAALNALDKARDIARAALQQEPTK